MATLTIRWTRFALLDLEQARRYIHDRNPRAAEHVAQRIEEGSLLPGLHPLIGRPGRVAGTRELVVTGTPFLLIYRVRSGVVEILSLLHSARRWPPLSKPNPNH